MIFYFSATGNTRWAAQKVAEATGDELISMATLPKDGNALRPLAEGERVGFCFPVHSWRPPINVRRYIEQLHLDTRGHYVYALCTAGDTTGEALDVMRSDLRRRGVELDAVFSLVMPESYVGLPTFNVDPPEKEKQKIDEAAALLRKHIDAIVARQPQTMQPHRGRWPRTNTRLLGAFFTRYLISDKPFHVDSARCVKCGICAEVCPTGDIIGGLGYEPKWQHDGSCLTCFACYHHCPHHAIEFGRETQHKGQYFYNRPHRR